MCSTPCARRVITAALIHGAAIATGCRASRMSMRWWPGIRSCRSLIASSRWRCDHGWDIDLDDGSSNYHIYNNLCLNGGIKNREGYGRIVENNILVNNTFHPHVWYANSGDVFRRNIVFEKYRPVGMQLPWGA